MGLELWPCCGLWVAPMERSTQAIPLPMKLPIDVSFAIGASMSTP